MISILLTWAASAIALYVTTQVVPGVKVSSIMAAVIAALVIGLVNATVGNLLKLLTFPIGCLTLGLSRLVINGLMFMLAAKLVDGFAVSGFLAAFFGAIVMAGVGWGMDMALKNLTGDGKDQKR
ncbi:MAG: phage holin family protein [Bryobacter sp.]|nr:phage holin family protein [Bryobacter sp.]